MSSISPARTVAFTVVRRVFEQGAYADRALAGEAFGLEPRERSFATQLAYGTVQRRATLDHVAERLSGRDVERLDAHVLAALRLGLFQLLYLDGVAGHAAVNESVELAKRGGGPGFRLVNAVMRRATREGPAILAALDDRTSDRAALCHSVPGWLAERWWAELGADGARRELRHVNEPAESALRVNTLLSTCETVAAALPVASRKAANLPEGLVLEGPFDVQASDMWQAGSIMPQSRASMAVARVLGPLAGERVLDLCSAPGGKTTHLAALMEDRGEIVAIERHSGRAAALRVTCERMGVSSVRVQVADAGDPLPGERFDRVLVDPPCSGLGTLAARPDLRWRANPAKITELAALQGRILAAGAAATAPGGSLVYSVCTISALESEAVIEGFLSASAEFEADDLQVEYPQWSHPRLARHLQLLPAREHTDGFFIARLRRA